MLWYAYGNNYAPQLGSIMLLIIVKGWRKLWVSKQTTIFEDVYKFVYIYQLKCMRCVYGHLVYVCLNELHKMAGILLYLDEICSCITYLVLIWYVNTYVCRCGRYTYFYKNKIQLENSQQTSQWKQYNIFANVYKIF